MDRSTRAAGSKPSARCVCCARWQLNWQKTLTAAFGEVSTALNGHEKFAEAVREETRSVNAYRESVRLSTIRYNSGFASYFEVLDAQLNLYPAETTRVFLELAHKVSLVSIYRSLGGGWKLSMPIDQSGSRYCSIGHQPSSHSHLTPKP
jgi:outer membrane protein TolC